MCWRHLPPYPNVSYLMSCVGSRRQGGIPLRFLGETADHVDLLIKETSLLLDNNQTLASRLRPSALALSSTFFSPDEYYVDASSFADVPRPMRHSDGVSASSYRDYYLSSATQPPPRVPPTPAGHARPFTRSSSVPDQSHYNEALSDIEDALLGLGPGSPLSSARLDPLSSSTFSSRPRYQDWRTGSYSISSALRARGQSQNSLRLGRQFSVSSELPTSDPLSRSSLYNNYPSDLGLGLGRVSLSTGPYSGLPGVGLGVKDHDVLLQARLPPLTLGRSLQLVTENFGRYSSTDRRKKTVRFNSEDWHRQAALYGRNALPPYLSGNYASSLGAPGSGTGLVDDPYFFLEDDSWMSLEDVRSGRWARWDALRQESQDSLARDSGVESGSCFTSSEDSNRGGEFYLTKKVFNAKGRYLLIEVDLWRVKREKIRSNWLKY